MRRRFFVEAFSGGKACLTGDAAHHLGRVLRAEPGQVYELSDGHAVFVGRIDRLSRDRIDFELIEPVSCPTSWLDITMLIAIVKFDRFEWALEKATELGVNTVIPVAAERSDKALVSAAPKRAARWQKILLESAQQARCLRPPSLKAPERASPAFGRVPGVIKLLFSERSTAPPVQTLMREVASKICRETPSQMALAVGPEGGWTDQEFAAASAAGFKEASLGQNILRTETAVVAGLAAVSCISAVAG
ncbi:MAG TPA: RsmE family RNA methyltransferase [Candidatus Acidoferrales bacterium]|nr:RsmE family RNA methyltransferase [Candidatus Acidoferrales bacterium]